MFPFTVHVEVVRLLKITALLDAPPEAESVPVPPTTTVGEEPKLMICAVGVPTCTFNTNPVDVLGALFASPR